MNKFFLCLASISLSLSLPAQASSENTSLPTLLQRLNHSVKAEGPRAKSSLVLVREINNRVNEYYAALRSHQNISLGAIQATLDKESGLIVKIPALNAKSLKYWYEVSLEANSTLIRVLLQDQNKVIAMDAILLGH